MSDLGKPFLPWGNAHLARALANSEGVGPGDLNIAFRQVSGLRSIGIIVATFLAVAATVTSLAMGGSIKADLVAGAFAFMDFYLLSRQVATRSFRLGEGLRSDYSVVERAAKNGRPKGNFWGAKPDFT